MLALLMLVDIGSAFLLPTHSTGKAGAHVGATDKVR